MFFLLGPLTIQEKIEEKLIVWMGAHCIEKASGFSWNTQKTNTYIAIFFWAIRTTAEQKRGGSSTWEICPGFLRCSRDLTSFRQAKGNVLGIKVLF